MKHTPTDLLRYELILQARDAEIAKLKSQCEKYRIALSISSSRAEKLLREKLAAVMLERDELREQLKRRSEVPKTNEYLNFMVILDAATTFNAADFADWVRDHQVELSVGFQRSGEDEPAVYARVQYSRAMGLGV